MSLKDDYENARERRELEEAGARKNESERERLTRERRERVEANLRSNEKFLATKGISLQQSGDATLLVHDRFHLRVTCDAPDSISVSVREEGQDPGPPSRSRQFDQWPKASKQIGIWLDHFLTAYENS